MSLNYTVGWYLIRTEVRICIWVMVQTWTLYEDRVESGYNVVRWV